MVGKLVVETVGWLVAMAVLLFVPAGTVDWPGAWMFLAITGVAGIAIGLWLARHDPDLLAERLAPPLQRGQQGWDKIFVPVVMVVWCTRLVFMALDAERFGWSHVPPWTQSLGALGVVLGMYIAFLALRANHYAAPVVKVQRSQTVATAGPYRHVRHPMYAGAALFFVAAPLLLGSWYGLLWAPALIALLGARAVLEERTLAAELTGYRDYAARVRYRLVPHVW